MVSPCLGSLLCNAAGHCGKTADRASSIGSLHGGITMVLDLTNEQLGVLRRALEARARDMRMHLGNDPDDEGFRREELLTI